MPSSTSPVRKKVMDPVGETERRFAGDDAGLQQMGQIAVKGDLPQTYDDANSRQRLNLASEMRGTVSNLLGLRFVAGRGAADDGGYPGMAQF